MPADMAAVYLLNSDEPSAVHAPTPTILLDAVGNPNSVDSEQAAEHIREVSWIRLASNAAAMCACMHHLTCIATLHMHGFFVLTCNVLSG